MEALLRGCITLSCLWLGCPNFTTDPYVQWSSYLSGCRCQVMDSCVQKGLLQFFNRFSILQRPPHARACLWYWSVCIRCQKNACGLSSHLTWKVRKGIPEECSRSSDERWRQHPVSVPTRWPHACSESDRGDHEELQRLLHLGVWSVEMTPWKKAGLILRDVRKEQQQHWEEC
jgi:hypothetical protein